MSGTYAKVILDSVSPAGARLTTMELRYARIIHAEFMAHRTFCLAGDSELEFDLPGGATKGYRRVCRMRIDEFVDKWVNGARRVGSKPKRECDLSWVEPARTYPAAEVAMRLGMATATNIHTHCRAGAIKAERSQDGRTWLVHGQSVIDWRGSTRGSNRYDMRARLWPPEFWTRLCKQAGCEQPLGKSGWQNISSRCLEMIREINRETYGE